jgi:hypothetical protein
MCAATGAHARTVRRCSHRHRVRMRAASTAASVPRPMAAPANPHRERALPRRMAAPPMRAPPINRRAPATKSAMIASEVSVAAADGVAEVAAAGMVRKPPTAMPAHQRPDSLRFDSKVPPMHRRGPTTRCPRRAKRPPIRRPAHRNQCRNARQRRNRGPRSRTQKRNTSSGHPRLRRRPVRITMTVR